MTGPGVNEAVVLARLLGVTISGLCAWDRVPGWVTPGPVVPGLAGIWSSARLRELRGDRSLEDLARKVSARQIFRLAAGGDFLLEEDLHAQLRAACPGVSWRPRAIGWVRATAASNAVDDSEDC